MKLKYSDLVSIVEFDDYALPVEKVPHWSSVPNWEVPEAYDYGLLMQDLEALLQGRSVEVMHLDVSVETRMSRRKLPFPSSEYVSQVFVPMNEKYVDSTKQYADKVISVDGCSREIVYSDVVNLLKKSGFL